MPPGCVGLVAVLGVAFRVDPAISPVSMRALKQSAHLSSAYARHIACELVTGLPIYGTLATSATRILQATNYGSAVAGRTLIESLPLMTTPEIDRC